MNITSHLIECSCGNLWFKKEVNVTLAAKTKQEYDKEVFYKCTKCGKVVSSKRIKE